METEKSIFPDLKSLQEKMATSISVNQNNSKKKLTFESVKENMNVDFIEDIINRKLTQEDLDKMETSYNERNGAIDISFLL